MLVTSDTVFETLCHARGTIDTPDKWCQKAFARDARGNALRSQEDVNNGYVNGERFGLVGALLYACHHLPRRVEIYRQLRKLLLAQHEYLCQKKNVHPLPGLSIFNDTHTHEDVLALLDSTIEDYKRGHFVQRPGETS